jgi:hypothetical protein
VKHLFYFLELLSDADGQVKGDVVPPVRLKAYIYCGWYMPQLKACFGDY